MLASNRLLTHPIENSVHSVQLELCHVIINATFPTMFTSHKGFIRASLLEFANCRSCNAAAKVAAMYCSFALVFS